MNLLRKLVFISLLAAVILCPGIKAFQETYIDLRAVSFITSRKGNTTLSRDTASVKPGKWAVLKKNFQIKDDSDTANVKLLMKFRLNTDEEGFSVEYRSSARMLNKTGDKPVEKTGKRQLRRGNSLLLEIMKISGSSKKLLFSLTPTIREKFIPSEAQVVSEKHIKQIDFDIVLYRIDGDRKKEIENTTLRTGLKESLDFEFKESIPKEKEEKLQLQKERFVMTLFPQKIKNGILHLRIKVRAEMIPPFSEKNSLSINRKKKYEINDVQTKTLTFSNSEKKGFRCKITPDF